MSFNINKKLVERNADGSIKKTPIKALSGKTYEYAKVSLPSNVNFGGFQDVNGVEVFGVNGASLLVPAYSVKDDKFNAEKDFIKLSDDYVFPTVNIDLGLTGKTLENGKQEHNFSKLANVPLAIVENSFGNKQWLSFTITDKMRGTDYINAQGENRTTVFIPGEGELSGGRFTINPRNIREIKNRDDLLAVSIHRDASFTVVKSEVASENIETGEKEYVNTVIGTEIKASDLAKYFEKPEVQEQNQEQTQEDAEEKSMDDNEEGLEV